MRLCNIYCEGKRGSHDNDILEKVLGDFRPNVEIKPIGGKRGCKAIMSYIEGQGLTASKANEYLMFRDRDFDQPVPAKEELTMDGHVCFSYRTTIENYLLDSLTMFEYDKEKGTGIFASVSDAERLLTDAACDIKSYQAVRHALGALRNGASFNTRWTEKDGVLPVKLGLDDCIDEAKKLVVDAKTKTDRWTEAVLRQEAERFLAVFDNDFFSHQQYLVWFQGKDLAKSICNRLNNFDMRLYYKFAKQRFDYTKFADLVELRTIVESKIQ